jgi:hypothetical protein
MCWYFVLEVTTGNGAGFSPRPFSFPLPVTIPPLLITVMSLLSAVHSNALWEICYAFIPCIVKQNIHISVSTAVMEQNEMSFAWVGKGDKRGNIAA